MLNIRVQDGFKKSSTQDVSVKRYFKELQRYPPMTRKEEGQTFHRARKGDQKAIE